MRPDARCKPSSAAKLIILASIIHTDGWRGYDGLVDAGFNKHFRGNYGHNKFARGMHHVNGIEFFWRFAKRRLAKFNGIARQ